MRSLKETREKYYKLCELLLGSFKRIEQKESYAEPVKSKIDNPFEATLFLIFLARNIGEELTNKAMEVNNTSPPEAESVLGELDSAVESAMDTYH